MDIRGFRWACIFLASAATAKYGELSSKQRPCHHVQQEVDGTVQVESNVEDGHDERVDIWRQLPVLVHSVYEVNSNRTRAEEENETDGEQHGGQTMDVPLPADLPCRADDATYGDEICNYDDDERRDARYGEVDPGESLPYFGM